ncbi:F0F1 ATP synthase subunit delta [Tetragenococcus koreensis]|uniref:F0F1 ATP synthase subunit delta n=1 Tax=Tetragenococcus koreensis TaxID=290335 RepID=UPI001F4726D8|nr:F0F1 ATP synthase subunit delta [Tetragenococcus koreensis]MCF1583993.1 F0F1 ATP synthase subunit delta [Tetragenococcus koreensis]MCF1613454.1 F0F1 ATP synthase subunit delta [Tetragenococcus koreensis]MCF1618807.1 F0F1 ATP synthase subunit delta [Tetragenococcus koreensis]MCF1623335.1 F0F1 ATP synthase subunit delta [Tetragenococcus koreensis]MCF1628231.1 F0F1 ATP synthase subunit delta [Tetragenococcus koreensis]
MKLDKNTVAKRYGKALYELAAEKGQIEDVYKELLALRDIFEAVPDLGNILSNRRLNLQEKRSIMNNLVENFDGIVHDTLEIIFQYGRMYDLLLIIDEYEKRYDEHKEILLGTVTSAIPLKKEQKAKLTANIAQKFGYKTANLQENVDPSIVGGIIVETKDRVIDGSIKTQIENLRKELSK